MMPWATFRRAWPANTAVREMAVVRNRATMPWAAGTATTVALDMTHLQPPQARPSGLPIGELLLHRPAVVERREPYPPAESDGEAPGRAGDGVGPDLCVDQQPSDRLDEGCEGLVLRPSRPLLFGWVPARRTTGGTVAAHPYSWPGSGRRRTRGRCGMAVFGGRRYRRAPVAALLVAVVALTGCGGPARRHRP